jgi:NADH dehydrogenase
MLNVLHPRFDRIIRYAEKTMMNYDIEIIANKRITKVSEHGAFLNDGSFLQSSMVISTIGQSRIVLKGTQNMEKDNLKRICTNEYLQIKNFSNIRGGGDACHVKHCKTMGPCPANALWAIKHGEYIGKNIGHNIKKQPLKKFNYRGLGQTASLGIGKGMEELYGIQFTGWIAWIMRLFVFTYFMPLRRVMFNEISDWMFLLFRGQRKELWIERKQMEKEKIFSLKQVSLNKVA